MAQPHVLLTVRDKRGKLLEAVQESPQVRLQGCMKLQTHKGAGVLVELGSASV